MYYLTIKNIFSLLALKKTVKFVANVFFNILKK